MPRFLTACAWGAFLGLFTLLIWRMGEPAWSVGPFRIDALALFIGTAVALVAAVVHSFAQRHMAGEARQAAFFARLAGLTALVLLLLAADSVLLFAGVWLAMGLLLAAAIGQVQGWPQAAAAAALARRYFLAGSALVAGALAILAAATGQFSISGIADQAGRASPILVGIACAALALAAAIQCGLFPFHRWLLSSVVAPTPVSAFMHAGLVNAGGILVARFAPAFEAVPLVLIGLFALGAASALMGQVVALVQSDIKRSLAASTTAQMGFMLLQCGLGFHAAAMAHLVLHGLYKASLFLGAGSALALARQPDAPADRGTTVAAGLIAATLAAGAFALTSGKATEGAGLLLVLFAALAAAHAAIAIGARQRRVRLLAAPLLLALVGGSYGAVMAGVEALLGATPGLTAPIPLNALHLAVGGAFALAWLGIAAGWHRRAPALHARLLVLSQPAAATVTDRREAYASA